MAHHEDHFDGHDGLRLFEQCWLPESEPEALVVAIHGFLEHGGRHARLAGLLNDQGYGVYAIDLRGHGRSEGARVFVDSFDDYLADLELFVDRVQRRHPGKPLLLFGHSMGGTIVGLFAATRQPEIRGVAMSAPAVIVGRGVFPLLRRLASFFSRWLPKLRIVSMDGRSISRDPEVVAAFRADPLVFHGRFPVRTGAEILQAALRLQEEIRNVRIPLLILQGTGDRVVSTEGARQIHMKAGSNDKTLHLYEGLYHELLGEPEKDQVTDDLIHWFNTHR
jgi:acylglycerol lipase